MPGVGGEGDFPEFTQAESGRNSSQAQGLSGTQLCPSGLGQHVGQGPSVGG